MTRPRRSRTQISWVLGCGKRDDIPVLGARVGISRATAYRYHDEAIRVLAERAPDLHDALEQAKEDGLPM